MNAYRLGARAPSRSSFLPAGGAPRTFTLVELLAGLAIAALVMGIIAGVFVNSLQAWQRASTEIALVTTGEDTMRRLVTGIGLRGSELGLQDSLAVLRATPHRIEVLPAQRKVYAVTPEHVIELDPRYQPGAPPPLAFLLPGRTPVPVEVNDEGSRISVPRRVTPGSRLEIFYRPVATDAKARLVLSLDRLHHKVQRAYGTEVRLLPVGNRGVRIEDIRFRYFLAGKEEAPVAMVDEHLGWIRGVGVTLKLARGRRVHEVRRVINLGNASSSVLVTGPARDVAVLPPPGRIKVFEMRYFAGAEIGGRVELRAGPWTCKMQMIAHDTALVTMSVAGMGTRQTTVHTAFGVTFLNPDVLLDADGSRTPGRGDPERDLELKPGLPVIPLGQEAGLRYLDRNRNGNYDLGESIFIDSDLDGRLGPGDRLLLGSLVQDDTAPARVLSGKTDNIAYHELQESKHFDDGEDLVMDGDGDGAFGGPFYDCCELEKGVTLSVTEFTIKGASIIIR